MLPPKRTPNDQERKKMTAIAIGWLVRHIMSNFLCTFGGENIKQSTGGPTGEEITQAVSRHLGNEYDELFLEICNKINIKIEMYDRYVDDQNTALRSFGRKVKFCPLDGELVPKTDDEIEVQKDLHEDQVVMEELRKVADTVIDMFKTETDSPGNHPELDFKVPILRCSYVGGKCEATCPRDGHQKLTLLL